MGVGRGGGGLVDGRSDHGGERLRGSHGRRGRGDRGGGGAGRGGGGGGGDCAPSRRMRERGGGRTGTKAKTHFQPEYLNFLVFV